MSAVVSPPASSRTDTAAQVVGYLEYVALPRWGLPCITAKVDTGADTSALHVERLELVGSTWVTFQAVDEGAELLRRSIKARIVRRGLVRSSNGGEEERIFVSTPVRLAGRTRTVEVGLVDRSRMQFRMLLGRSALEGVYLVDPARSYLGGPP